MEVDDALSAPAEADDAPSAPAASPLPATTPPTAAPPLTAALQAAKPSTALVAPEVPGEPTIIEPPDTEQQPSMLRTTGTYVAAAASAAVRGVAALRAARQESPPQATGAIRTASTDDQPPTPDTDGAWAMVEAADGESQRLNTRHSAFSALQEWEEARCADFKIVAAQHARVYDMLAKRAALGNQEQSEAVAYLTTRGAADAAYAAAISKQRLGGKPIVELGDLRSAAARADHASSNAVVPLCDSGGILEVQSVMSMLGCMMMQAADKMARFAADDSLAKELAQSATAFSTVAEHAIKDLKEVIEGLLRAHKGCVDAFAAHRAVFEEAERRSVESQAKAGTNEARKEAHAHVHTKDFWLAECCYRSEVATFHERLWQAGRTVREILERFRVAEHRRVTVLHGSLRMYVSLQQRLWADISAS